MICIIALPVFLTHILQIQRTIFGVKYINSTEFYPKLYQNQHAKTFKLYELKISCKFWKLIYAEGLIGGPILGFCSEGRGFLERGA